MTVATPQSSVAHDGLAGAECLRQQESGFHPGKMAKPLTPSQSPRRQGQTGNGKVVLPNPNCSAQLQAERRRCPQTSWVESNWSLLSSLRKASVSSIFKLRKAKLGIRNNWVSTASRGNLVIVLLIDYRL